MPPKAQPKEHTYYTPAEVREQVLEEQRQEPDLIAANYLPKDDYDVKLRQKLGSVTDSDFVSNYSNPVYSPPNLPQGSNPLSDSHPSDRKISDKSHKAYGYFYGNDGNYDKYLRAGRARNADFIAQTKAITDIKNPDGTTYKFKNYISPEDQEILGISKASIESALSDPNQITKETRYAQDSSGVNIVNSGEEVVLANAVGKDLRPYLTLKSDYTGRTVQYSAQRVLAIANERNSVRTLFANGKPESQTGRHLRYPKAQVNRDGFLLGGPKENSLDDGWKTNWLKEITSGAPGVKIDKKTGISYTIPPTRDYTKSDYLKLDYLKRVHKLKNVDLGMMYASDWNGNSMSKLSDASLGGSSLKDQAEYDATHWDNKPILEFESKVGKVVNYTNSLVPMSHPNRNISSADYNITVSENRYDLIQRILKDKVDSLSEGDIKPYVDAPREEVGEFDPVDPIDRLPLSSVRFNRFINAPREEVGGGFDPVEPIDRLPLSSARFNPFIDVPREGVGKLTSGQKFVGQLAKKFPISMRTTKPLKFV